MQTNKAMFGSRSSYQVHVVLSMMLLVIFSVHDQHRAFGARLLNYEKLKEDLMKVPVRSSEGSNSSSNGNEDFFATINREVPSCPDPLHNR